MCVEHHTCTWTAHINFLLRSGTAAPQDADSLSPEGKKTEGAFYLWTSKEVDEVLGPDAALFKAHYYVKPEGNADLSRMRCAAAHVYEPASLTVR